MSNQVIGAYLSKAINAHHRVVLEMRQHFNTFDGEIGSWRKNLDRETEIEELRTKELERMVECLLSVNVVVAPWPIGRNYAAERARWKKGIQRADKLTHIKGRWYISHDGCGGLLNPPGQAAHYWSLQEGKGNACRAIMGLESAFNPDYKDWIPDEVRVVAGELLEMFKGDPRDEAWIRSVYAYFRGCYSPDGENRNVGDCEIVRRNPQQELPMMLPPKERHLGYMFVRKWDPTHEIREDLL